MLKRTKIVGGWGSAPDPTGGAKSLQRSPDPLAVMGWDRDLVASTWWCPSTFRECPSNYLLLATGLTKYSIASRAARYAIPNLRKTVAG